MSNYCEKFFYPEKYKLECSDGQLIPQDGQCRAASHTCCHQLYIGPETYAILDNLRIIKEQNNKLLLCLRGHRRMK